MPAILVILAAVFFFAGPAIADEVPIGSPKVVNGMKLAPLYLHAVATDPER